MDLAWSKHVSSWQMLRWITTSVTPLFSLAFFLDVSLKWPSSGTSPWRDESWSLLFYTSSHWISIAHCLGFVCYWKLYLSGLDFALKENSILIKVEMLKSRRWWLLNPCFHCNCSSGGIGPWASVSAQLRFRLFKLQMPKNSNKA